MLHFAALLHTMGVSLVDRARTRLETDSERGSETIEKVLWAVGVIAIVGIVVTAIKAYVTTQTGNLK